MFALNPQPVLNAILTLVAHKVHSPNALINLGALKIVMDTSTVEKSERPSVLESYPDDYRERIKRNANEAKRRLAKRRLERKRRSHDHLEAI